MYFLVLTLLLALSQAAPATLPIGALLSKDDSFSIFYNLLQDANLLPDLDKASSLTVFAPPNAALLQTAADLAVTSRKTLPKTDNEAYKMLSDFFTPEARRYILLTHIVPGGRSFDDVVAQLKFNTASGDTLLRQGVRIVPVKIDKNLSKDIPPAELIVGPKGGMAAKNGMLHMVDRAILPLVPSKKLKVNMEVGK